MVKFLIWGTGTMAIRNYKIAKSIGILIQNEIIAFIDNNDKKWGTKFNGVSIISPYEIKNMQYDYICIWSIYKQEIFEQMNIKLNIPLEKRADIFKPYILNSIEKKYVTRGIEIQTILDNIRKERELHVYNFSPKFPRKLYEAFYDVEADLYYIYFEEKRLYMKRGYSFIVNDGKKYVKDIWYEQDPNSPHLYEDGETIVCNGDILVDAGACEGNFSLHHIEHVKKIYLIECDNEWINALQHTFAPYKGKVVFCNKFLSNIDKGNKISLDTLLNGTKISFLKMDIEGEEINALCGARNTLINSNYIKCSICSYHRHGDEEKITKILQSYGMHTTNSKGYMLFLYDEEIYINPELRRGIVRGIKHYNKIEKK